MANSDAQWSYDLRPYDQMDEEMRQGIQRLVDDTAESALVYARKFAPNTTMSRGYATGALALSGYTISVSGSGYLAAVAAAKAAPKTRIEARNQILPEFPLHTLDVNNPDMAFAVMDFPTTYANLIRNGFHNRKAKKFVIGIDYVTSAVNRVNAGMQTAANKLVRQVTDRPR